MGDPAAQRSLLDSAAAWSKFCEAPNSGLIDLRLSEFRGVDLSGRRFVRCDLTGATFAGQTNLDDSDFESCVLNGVVFTDASLVRARFTDCNGTNVSFAGAVLRDATFAGPASTGSRSQVHTYTAQRRVTAGLRMSTRSRPAPGCMPSGVLWTGCGLQTSSSGNFGCAIAPSSART